MKPAIDQMIAWLEGEMAKYAVPTASMDKGFRVLEQSHRQALKIKERCRDEAMQALIGRVCVSDRGIQVVEIPNEHHGDVGTTNYKFGPILNLHVDGRVETDPR